MTMVSLKNSSLLLHAESFGFPIIINER